MLGLHLADELERGKVYLDERAILAADEEARL